MQTITEDAETQLCIIADGSNHLYHIDCMIEAHKQFKANNRPCLFCNDTINDCTTLKSNASKSVDRHTFCAGMRSEVDGMHNDEDGQYFYRKVYINGTEAVNRSDIMSCDNDDDKQNDDNNGDNNDRQNDDNDSDNATFSDNNGNNNDDNQNDDNHSKSTAMNEIDINNQNVDNNQNDNNDIGEDYTAMKYIDAVDTLKRKVSGYNAIAEESFMYQGRLKNALYAWSITENKKELNFCNANLEIQSAEICELHDEILSLNQKHVFTTLENAIVDVFRDQTNKKPFRNLEKRLNFLDYLVCPYCIGKRSVCKCNI